MVGTIEEEIKEGGRQGERKGWSEDKRGRKR